MSDKDPVALLRQIYPQLNDTQKEVVKEVVDIVQANQDDLTRLLETPLPEAEASVNFRMVHTATQVECQFTLRGHGDVNLQERLTKTVSRLAKIGYISFDTYVDQRRGDRGETKATNGAAPPKGTANAPAKASPKAPNTESFQAESMEATIYKGKTYWKVKGGKRFNKFGVTIWPEVLEEAGFNLDELDTNEVYNLSDYQATASIKEDGKPEKVTKLERL